MNIFSDLPAEDAVILFTVLYVLAEFGIEYSSKDDRDDSKISYIVGTIYANYKERNVKSIDPAIEKVAKVYNTDKSSVHTAMSDLLSSTFRQTSPEQFTKLSRLHLQPQDLTVTSFVCGIVQHLLNHPEKMGTTSISI